MNTIPLIFNERQIKRTVLGGKTGIDYTIYLGCAVILLNRGGNHYRQKNIENLIRSGFAEVISVENSSRSYSLEEFAQRYPQVKFVIPLEDVSAGDMINIGISEAISDYALVIWDDIHISPNLIPTVLATKLMNTGKLCLAPFLQSERLQSLPVQMIPCIKKKSFFAKPTPVIADGTNTIYPFDYIGFYNRQKFMQLGGYDHTITTPYWQNLDFSLRAWLWGEEITLISQFKLTYEDETIIEDTTADYKQLRFFLKNCAPVFRSDYAYIPLVQFFSFLCRYPGSPFEAYAQFKDARKWVYTNRFRFKTDIAKLVNSWNKNTVAKESR